MGERILGIGIGIGVKPDMLLVVVLLRDWRAASDEGAGDEGVEQAREPAGRGWSGTAEARAFTLEGTGAVERENCRVDVETERRRVARREGHTPGLGSARIVRRDAGAPWAEP